MPDADIITERLHLTPFSLELIQAAIRAPAEVGQILNATVAPGWPEADFAEILPMLADELTRAPDRASWTRFIMVAATRTIIGDIGFRTTATPDVIEIGYGLVPTKWGHGYATEAARGMITWAFAQTEIQAIMAESEVENHRSARVLKKLGMTQTGQIETLLQWNLTRNTFMQVNGTNG